MDDMFQPENSKIKTYVIAGSIAAVVVGLIVVGLLFYRQRALQSTQGQPTAAPPATGGSAPGAPSTLGGSTATTGSTTPSGTSTPTSQGSTRPNAPVDLGSAPDTDKDGLTDAEEAVYGTDPAKPDTDGDGYTDYQEVRIYGTNPLDPNSNPKTVQGLYSPDKGQPSP